MNTDSSKRTLTSLWKKYDSGSFFIKLPETKMTSINYTRVMTIEKKQYFKGNFVVVDPSFLKDLGVDELKMILQIIEEIKKNNALWHYQYRKIGGRSERTILKLRKREVIFETENKDFHMINPFAIRKGTLPTVIATTNELIHREKFSTSLIRDLRAPGEAKINLFYSLLDNN